MLLHQIRDSIENGYPKDTENYIQQALKEGYPIKSRIVAMSFCEPRSCQ